MRTDLSNEINFVKAVAEQAYSSGRDYAAGDIRGFVGYANGRVFKFSTHLGENWFLSDDASWNQEKSCRDLRAMLATVSSRFLARIKEVSLEKSFKATLRNLGIKVNKTGPLKGTCVPMAAFDRELLSRKILADWVNHISIAVQRDNECLDRLRKGDPNALDVEKKGKLANADVEGAARAGLVAVKGRGRVEKTSFGSGRAGWGTWVGGADFIREGDISENDVREAMETLKWCTLARHESGVRCLWYAHGNRRGEVGFADVVKMHAVLKQALAVRLGHWEDSMQCEEIARNLATLDCCIRSLKTVEGERSFVRWDGRKPQERVDYDSAIDRHLEIAKRLDEVLAGKKEEIRLDLGAELYLDRADPYEGASDLFDRDVVERLRVFARTAGAGGLQARLENLWEQAFGAGDTSAAKACWDDLAECALSMLGLLESSSQRVLAKAQLEKGLDYGRLLKYLPQGTSRKEVERAFSAAFLASVEWIGHDDAFFNQFARKGTRTEIFDRERELKALGEIVASENPGEGERNGEPKAAGTIDVSKLGWYWLVDNPQGFDDRNPDQGDLPGKDLREDWTKRLFAVFGIEGDGPDEWKLLLNRLGFDPRADTRRGVRLTGEEVTTVNARISEIMAREAETRQIMRPLALFLKRTYICGEGGANAFYKTDNKEQDVTDLEALRDAVPEDGELSVETAVNALLSRRGEGRSALPGLSRDFLDQLAAGLDGITCDQLADAVTSREDGAYACIQETILDWLKVNRPRQADLACVRQTVARALAGAVCKLNLIDLGDCQVLFKEKFGEFAFMADNDNGVRPIANDLCAGLLKFGLIDEANKSQVCDALVSTLQSLRDSIDDPRKVALAVKKTLKRCREFSLRDIPPCRWHHDPAFVRRFLKTLHRNDIKIDFKKKHIPAQLFAFCLMQINPKKRGVFVSRFYETLVSSIGDASLRQFAFAQKPKASVEEIFKDALTAWEQGDMKAFLETFRKAFQLTPLKGKAFCFPSDQIEAAMWSMFEHRLMLREERSDDREVGPRWFEKWEEGGTLFRKFESTVTVPVPFSQNQGERQAPCDFKVRTEPIELEGQDRELLVNIAKSSLTTENSTYVWLRFGIAGLKYADDDLLSDAGSLLEQQRNRDRQGGVNDTRKKYVRFDFTTLKESPKAFEDPKRCLHIRLPIQEPNLVSSYSYPNVKPSDFATTRDNINTLIEQLASHAEALEGNELKIFNSLLESVKSFASASIYNREQIDGSEEAKEGFLPFAEKLMLLTVRAGFVPYINCYAGRDRTGAMDSSLKMMLAKYEALKERMEEEPALELADKDILSAIELTPEERLRAIDMTQNDEIALETTGKRWDVNLTQRSCGPFIRRFLPRPIDRLESDLACLRAGRQLGTDTWNLRFARGVRPDGERKGHIVSGRPLKNLLLRMKTSIEQAPQQYAFNSADTLTDRVVSLFAALRCLAEVRRYGLSKESRTLARLFFQRFCKGLELDRWESARLEDALFVPNPGNAHFSSFWKLCNEGVRSPLRVLDETLDITLELPGKYDGHFANDDGSDDDENNIVNGDDENNIVNEQVKSGKVPDDKPYGIENSEFLIDTTTK